MSFSNQNALSGVATAVHNPGYGSAEHFANLVLRLVSIKPDDQAGDVPSLIVRVHERLRKRIDGESRALPRLMMSTLMSDLERVVEVGSRLPYEVLSIAAIEAATDRTQDLAQHTRRNQA